MSEDKLKILFVVNDLGYGGAERTVSYLSDYMAEQGDKVGICLLGDKVCYKINDKIKIKKGNIDSCSVTTWGRLWNAIRRLVFLNKAIDEEKPDVVFFIMATLSKYVVFSPFRKYKLIVSERANPKFYDKNTLNLEKKIFEKCDGIVFQTERVKALFDESTRAKSVVIPNAVGNEYVYDTEWNPDGRKVISAVGRLSAEKNYPLMIEAFSIFWETHQDYSLEIYGDGPEKEKIQGLIETSIVRNNVHLMGTFPDAIKKISDSKVYLLTSTYEGMPNTLMEAMAIGMPCIATDCEFGPAELIETEVNGLLVPVNDTRAIAQSLSRVVDDEAFLVALGRNAKRILEFQSVGTVSEEYRKFLKRDFFD